MSTIRLQTRGIPSIVTILLDASSEYPKNVTFQNANKYGVTTDQGVVHEGVIAVVREILKVSHFDDPLLKSSVFDDVTENWLRKLYSSDANIREIFSSDVLQAVNSGYVAGNSMGLSDVFVFCSLFDNPKIYLNIIKQNQLSVVTWFSRCLEVPLISTFVNKKDNVLKFKSFESGLPLAPKLAELPDAVNGEVVVRFPPEASGYLHIGHAKAALLNQLYKEKYSGKFIFRFDDTNPSKEDKFFEDAILEDANYLGLRPDVFSRSSAYFSQLQAYARQLINSGDAFCDDTPGEIMKAQRAEMKASACRDRSIEENLLIWDEMLTGSQKGQKFCLRAKIDYQSLNGCMRDPTIFRCKTESHAATADEFKCYPTYDFCCPIVDSLEGVTHALRTTEYNDRDAQYYWFLEKLGLRKPLICAYSRLNLQYTLLSKRKLSWLVDNNVVSGWDDPRFPTVRGLRRRGLELDALKKFIIMQGFSKNVNNMSSDKIWSINKQILEHESVRYTALCSNEIVKVEVSNMHDMDVVRQVPKNPTNLEMGDRSVTASQFLYVERQDLSSTKVGDKITFYNIGNMLVEKIDLSQKEASIVVQFLPSDKSFRNTLKVTWLDCSQSLIPIKMHSYGELLNKPFLKEFEKFENFVNRDSETIIDALGETDMKGLVKGQKIQVLRRGFYVCDVAYSDESPCVKLIQIPDSSNQKPKVDDEKCSPKEAPSASNDLKSRMTELAKKITLQERLVKKLKSKSSNELDSNLALLENMRTEYKNLSDLKSKGGAAALSQISDPDLAEKITQQGNLVKKLKAEKADKALIDEEVKKLLELKNSSQKAIAPHKEEDSKGKKTTKLCLENTKSNNIGEWYSELIVKAELLDYYDVSGCYILRPDSYRIWDVIRDSLDKKITAIGVRNCYFPMFVSQASLEKEKHHIEDFSPEVAWVTRSGDTELAEPIAIRPTSETVMYPAFAKWIQSHRDLPLRLNQWCNIVRWEFKNPTPFLRSREFLWQEGHSAFATKDEAVSEVFEILDIYQQIYEDILAVPVIKGVKTEKEKFPGGEFTTTLEAFVPENGRAIQAATSHHLGQNFSKMFDIKFQDPATLEMLQVYQNSWGFTTRSIGIAIMVHSDDKGLVLPPKVAGVQVVVIPCGLTVKTSADTKEKLIAYCEKFRSDMARNGLASVCDLRDNVSPGWKFNHWELKGVPLRVEIGPKELQNKEVCICRRDTGDKANYANSESIHQVVVGLLERIQKELLEKALERMKRHYIDVTTWDEFLHGLNRKMMVCAPFCGDPECEESIKKDSSLEKNQKLLEELMSQDPNISTMGAKSLCIPLEHSKEKLSGVNCIYPSCNKDAVHRTLFGRSY